MCDVCGIRPAVVTVRRTVPGEPPRIEHLCEVHAAEARGGRSAFGGSPLGGSSLFDEFFGRFFDEGPQGTAPGRAAAPRQRAEQVDITRYFSDATTELLQRRAVGHGAG
jgi:ATP-dependent Clp protease ATP-binding subunit ClpC